MARMFSQDFIYKDTTYAATITISGLNGNKTISIKVPSEFDNIVPKGEFVVKADIEKQEDSLSKYPVLIKNILAAVDKHEEGTPAISLW